jgi:hypothetical protein
MRIGAMEYWSIGVVGSDSEGYAAFSNHYSISPLLQYSTFEDKQFS